MDFEPLTTAEQKIVDDVDKMFGEKDITLKNIVLYTRLLQLYPNDEEIKNKLDKIKSRVRKIHEETYKNVERELKCTIDKEGNIFPISNV